MQTTPTAVLRVEEDIGLTAARQIAASIEQQPAGDICVDFSGTRAMAPGALGVIAEALARHTGAVTVVGLSRHEVRILRYLGIRVVGSEEDDLYEPADGD